MALLVWTYFFPCLLPISTCYDSGGEENLHIYLLGRKVLVYWRHISSISWYLWSSLHLYNRVLLCYLTFVFPSVLLCQDAQDSQGKYMSHILVHDDLLFLAHIICKRESWTWKSFIHICLMHIAKIHMTCLILLPCVCPCIPKQLSFKGIAQI